MLFYAVTSFWGLLRVLIFALPLYAAVISALVGANKYLVNSSEGQPQLKNQRRIFLVAGTIFLSTQILAISSRLVTQERSVVYFAIEYVAVMAISFQVLCGSRIDKTRALAILGEVGAFFFLEIACKTLPFSYYCGNTDIMLHESYAKSIIENGHILSAGSEGYSLFPLMHVLSASYAQVASAASTEQAILLLFAVCGFCIPFVVCGIAKHVTRDMSFALTMAFVSSLGYAMLSWFSEGMPYALAFFFFLFILLIALRLRITARLSLVGVAFIIAIVLTHQVSIPYFAASLLIAIALFRTYRLAGRKARFSGFSMFFLLCLIYVAYSIISAISFYGVLILRPIPHNEIRLPLSSFGESLILVKYAGNLSVMILYYFLFAGILYTLGYFTPFKRTSHRYLVALAGLIAAFLYAPGVPQTISLLQMYISVGTRLSLVVEGAVFFIVVIALIGILKNASKWKRIAVPIAVATMVFGGISSVLNTNDTFALGGTGEKAIIHFEETDMFSIYFVRSESANTTVFADWISGRYMNTHEIRTVVPSVEPDGSVFYGGDSLIYLKTVDLETNGLFFYHVDIGNVAEFPKLGPMSAAPFKDSVDVIYDCGGIAICTWPDETRIGGK
jgi:low affinity Fe/Cu permease